MARRNKVQKLSFIAIFLMFCVFSVSGIFQALIQGLLKNMLGDATFLGTDAADFILNGITGMCGLVFAYFGKGIIFDEW